MATGYDHSVQRTPHSRWPVSSDEPALRAALCPQGASATSALAWCSERSWSELSTPQRKLQPTLRRALEQQGTAHPWHAQVIAYEQRIAERNALLAEAAADVHRALHGAGLRPVLLKGTALLARGVHAPDCRPMDDVDVKVDPSDYAAAAQALLAAGYHRRKGEHHSRYAHALDFGREGDRNVDLHGWMSPLGTSAAAERAFAARAEQIQYAGAAVLVPGTADLLLHACLSGFPAGKQRNLQWLLDAAALLRQGLSAEQWEVFEQAAIEREVVLPAREALAYLREVLEQSVPAPVLARLYARAPSVRDRLCYTTLVEHPAGLDDILLLHALHYDVGRCAYGESFSPRRLLQHMGERYMTLRGVSSMRDLPLHASRRLLQRMRR